MVRCGGPDGRGGLRCSACSSVLCWTAGVEPAVLLFPASVRIRVRPLTFRSPLHVQKLSRGFPGMPIHGLGAWPCLCRVRCGRRCPGRLSRAGADGVSLRAGGSPVSSVRRGDSAGGSEEAGAAPRIGPTSSASYVVRCTFWTLRSCYHQVLPGFRRAAAEATGRYVVPGGQCSDGWRPLQCQPADSFIFPIHDLRALTVRIEHYRSYTPRIGPVARRRWSRRPDRGCRAPPVQLPACPHDQRKRSLGD